MTRQDYLLKQIKRYSDTALEHKMRQTQRPLSTTYHGMCLEFHFGPSMSYDVTIILHGDLLVSTTMGELKRAVANGWTVREDRW